MRFHRLALSMVAIMALSSLSPYQSNKLMARAEEDDGDITTTEDDDAASAVPTYTPPENAESFQFEAEVHRMMDIVVNSLYQNKDVFLRELISNASDALDKIRFLGLTQPELIGEGTPEEYEVRIEYDEDAKTLTVRDTGIGMTKDDLIKNLGTVARSGTTKFLEALNEDSADMGMIGQFGVGFYSAFLVADRVIVSSKHPTEDVQHVWSSQNGESAFLVAPDPRGNTLGRGTEITLHLKEDASDYANARKLKDLVSYYSEFITHPIYVRTTSTTMVPVEKDEEDVDEEKKEDDEDDLEIDDEDKEEEEEEKEPEMEEVTTHSWDKVNANQAIWTRDKDSITDEEYQSFYKTISKGFDEAAKWSHFNAEGSINFKSILYLPDEIPPSLKFGNFDDDKHGLKLYVRKVLISDSFELLPRYLQFIKGVVDSDDLPLNVNRETLQESKIIKIIQKKLIRKAIEMMRKFSEQSKKEKEEKEDGDEDDEDKEKEEDEKDEVEEEEKEDPYITWFKKFGPSLKMGIMEDDANRPKLAKLLRFKTSKFHGDDDWVSLEEYQSRMKEWQNEMYYFAAESISDMEDSPYMDMYRKKDVEVLYFDDPVDEYLMNSMPTYESKKFQSIAKEDVKLHGDEDADYIRRRDKAYKAKYAPLTKWLKKIYGSSVQRVIVSNKLETAPAIISAASYTHSANMERILKAQAFQHGRNPQEIMATRIFEINPRHPFVTTLLEAAPEEEDDKPSDEDDGESPKEKKKVPQNFIDGAWMLHDMALLNSGFPLHDVKQFTKRLMRTTKNTLGVETLEMAPEIDVPEEEDEPPEPDFDGMMDGMGGMNMDDFDFDSLGEEL